ncbi:MAG: DNA repair protein RecO [Spirochaetes bacterium]|nr:DNA repair protein RecO [Spirochaetota bacterium]
MEIQKSTGIVLSSRSANEADYFCTILTKEFGKRDFVFKGLRKSKKRSLVISEPGTVASFVYYFHEDKKSYIVNEHNIIKHMLNIKDDLKKIYLLYFLVSLVEKTTGYNDCNKSIFELTAAGIDNIPAVKYPEHLSVFFLLHLLRMQGILPDFNRCKICAKENYKGFFIDTNDFQPVCIGCINSIKNKTISFGSSIKNYIIESLKKKYSLIDYSLYSSASVLNLLFSMTLFIEDYYHIKIKPKDLLISELSAKYK